MEGGRFIRIVACACLALVAPSCGGATGDRSDERGVRTAVRDLQRAFADGDLDRLCTRVTEAAELQAASFAHGSPESCPKDLRQALRAIKRGGGFAGSSDARVARVRVDGDRATATVALGDRTVDVPLAKKGGRWRMDSFFGAPTDAALRLVEDARERPFPAATTGGNVEAADAMGRPCPSFEEGDFPRIDGGCDLRLSGSKLAVTVLTPFGDFRFSDCEISYDTRIDATGRAWTTYFDSGDLGDVDTGCQDLEACFDQSPANPVPWRGRIRSDGRGAYVHEIDACFWSCVGFFTGKLAVRLVPDGRGWRAEPADLVVGSSGLRLTGKLASSGSPRLGLRSEDGS